MAFSNKEAAGARMDACSGGARRCAAAICGGVAVAAGSLLAAPATAATMTTATMNTAAHKCAAVVCGGVAVAAGSVLAVPALVAGHGVAAAAGSLLAVPALARGSLGCLRWLRAGRGEIPAFPGSRDSDSSMLKIQDAQAKAIQTLRDFSQAATEGQSQKAAGHFAKRGRYVDLFNRTSVGAEDIGQALENWNAKHENEGEWSANPMLGYERTLDVVCQQFKAKHPAVQMAFVEGSAITRMVVKPKQSALACVLAFQYARTHTNTEAALEQMTKNVQWKTWNGLEFNGKEAVRKLLTDHKRRGEERRGLTDFVMEKQTPDGSIWTRMKEIVRTDGVKVWAVQTITVVSQVVKKQPVHVTASQERAVFATVPKISHILVTPVLDTPAPAQKAAPAHNAAPAHH